MRKYELTFLKIKLTKDKEASKQKKWSCIRSFFGASAISPHKLNEAFLLLVSVNLKEELLARFNLLRSIYPHLYLCVSLCMSVALSISMSLRPLVSLYLSPHLSVSLSMSLSHSLILSLHLYCPCVYLPCPLHLIKMLSLSFFSLFSTFFSFISVSHFSPSVSST